ncbi:hypothetical protein Ga0061063_2728 [Gulbenkiania indica]|uniref:Uncharacterized protein n=2 Tax=Gulbenkiania TaxID=397456 RepID=A0A0K6H7A0_9NEIS|nr:DUF6610 family protein [Gulbenkiania indica]TCW33718.1 hypothetical protein EV669_101244 [Gulbenkiania mobilis]CUA86597.1 hypothetical protein Ga0061063_2728 [Gulbenkiania indica]
MSAPLKFVAHSRHVITLAAEFGWRPGARYTNLRDVRNVDFAGVGFLDIHWKRYDFMRHLAAAERLRPFMTVARDIESVQQLDAILREAEALQRFARHVVLVPKDPALHRRFHALLPPHFVPGFSVPTRYGGTALPPENYTRPVHLLGGRPDVQRRYADLMPVASLDCNRFTLDARFGDYFDGEIFRPHPQGGYDTCLRDSLANINHSWRGYRATALASGEKAHE